MLLLAIDTSTTAISVAVHDGRDVVAERVVLDARRHTEHLAPGIAGALADAGARAQDVTVVAVGTGPGPFTGLRVGVVTALTFGHVRGLPVLGVCSLDALAHAHVVDGHVRTEFVVATDARRKEVYWGRYAVDPGAAGGVRSVHGPSVARPSQVPAEDRDLPTAGRGPLLYPEAFPHAVGPLDVPASSVAALALARERAGLDQPVTPLYLRRPDAAEPGVLKATLVPSPLPQGAGR